MLLGKKVQSLQSKASKSLFQTIKDHNCREAKRISFVSISISVDEELKKMGYDLDCVRLSEGEDYSYKPLQLVISKGIDQKCRDDLLAGLQNVDLEIKIINRSDGKKVLKFYYIT